MKNRIILIAFLFFVSVNIGAQSLNQLLSDRTKNFKDIETELKKNDKYLKEASKKDRKMYDRWRWFWNTRVDSTGSFEKYNIEMNNYFKKIYPEGVVVPKALKSASSLNWTCLGPTTRPSGTDATIGCGRIRSIWINPNNFDTIMIGANSGGLWKTTDGGTSWICLTNNLMTGGVFGIAVDPNNTNIIYIATGLYITPRGNVGLSGNYSLGLFKSTNGGSSWTKLNITTSTGEFLSNILMHPTNSSILYALSNKKVYKTTNAGSTWTATSLATSGDQILMDIVFKPNDPNTIYVSGYNNALYKTTNAGSSWSNLSLNMQGLYTNSRIAISTNPNDANDLYALYCDIDHSNNNKLEKSDDGGSNWSIIFNTNLTAVHYAIAIKLSPNGDIFAGGINLKKSTDDGNSFPTTLNNSSIHVDFMDIKFPDPNDNDLIYVANDGGIYMDDAGGVSWSRINGNLAINEFYDVGILPGNSNVMVGGTHDCGSYLRDNSGNWSFKLGGDGGTSVYDHSGNGVYYLTANRVLYRYTGTSQLYLKHLEFYDSPVCMDPVDNDNLILQIWDSTQSPAALLQKTTDRGQTWTTIDQDWNNARAITMCEANTDFIYYCMWDSWENAVAKIRRTSDGGANWEDVDYSDISSIRQIAPINCVYVHHYDSQKVWAIFGGFEEDDKIFYSEDAGDNWQNITGTGLPNIPIQCFEYDFLNQTMFVGTDVGVYYCNMDNNIWTYAGDLPRAIISNIKLNKFTGDLVVSTYGRAIWSANLGEGYCYDSTPLNINSNTTWGTNNEVCKDVNINTGYTLKVTADIVMSFKSLITVKSNATLEIDDGLIKNGKILVENGGNLIIKNNGKIILNNTVLEVNAGATMDFPYGEIDAKQ